MTNETKPITASELIDVLSKLPGDTTVYIKRTEVDGWGEREETVIPLPASNFWIYTTEDGALIVDAT